MSGEIEEFSDAEKGPEGMSFMDTVKVYTDLEATVPPHQERSPAQSHASPLHSVTQSAGRSHSINASDEQDKSASLEDEQGDNNGLEDLSSTPSIPSTPSPTNDFWNPVPVSNASRLFTPKANSSQPLLTPSTSTRKVGPPPF